MKKTCREIYGFTGNDLLDLVDPLARGTRIKFLALNDKARLPYFGPKLAQMESLLENERNPEIRRNIKTQINALEEGVVLKFQRIFAKGNTWYGSRGFYPQGVSEKAFLQFMEALRNFSLATYDECRKKSVLSSSPFLDEPLAEYRSRFPEDDKIRLKDLMTWVFYERFGSFNEITYSLDKVRSFPDLFEPECNRELGNAILFFDQMTRWVVKPYDPTYRSDETRYREALASVVSGLQ